ncbi:NarK family nitrate/nitrite MFS transporter [Cytobacillus sp. IB215665]|uniref:NarK family nitrate/nitrite MFS transporter n=1 Tax=Cytobacillus sp. IB215665 TaxID=3097357 RepID=UPI002A16F0B3|nr:NarK family nitrate/nitrite MFS transporter [Cytobacillus sp. IB215665]MDX8364373.1 NarK family nitrate/nitrite MFS transporter [Cytobacillus sp. IB215665]
MNENIYEGNKKILFMTTFAFFLSFVVWFNMAPFNTTLMKVLQLTKEQITVLMTINVALTIPARIIIGMLVDRFGPRKVYSSLLIVMSIPCFVFAFGTSFWQLFIARAFLGIIGAGFVIGIRMVSEWFPQKQLGLVEGIYGGWGNFGSAAAAFSLPIIALWVGGDDGWRYAIGLTGLLSLIYGFIYYRSVQDTPAKKVYQIPKRSGAMEVTSYKSMIGLIVMTLPLYGVLGLLTWKLKNVNFIGANIALAIYIVLAVLYLFNVYKIWSVNKHHLKTGVPKEEQYSFKQVAILDFAYLITFGSELAVVSMLPMFFEETFNLTVAQAGMIGGSFAFMNLVARPGGGWLSDKFGRKKTLMVLLLCLGAAYIAMSQISSSWSLVAAVLLTMVCSFFVQAGEGSVFSMVPLVKKRITGQVAGMVGAYGNVGSVIFLTVLSFLNPSLFFMIIGIGAFACFIAAFFLVEPKLENEAIVAAMEPKQEELVG